MTSFLASAVVADVQGATHQAPQTLQVAVGAPVADRTFGRVRLQFAVRTRVADVPRGQYTAPTGRIWVATSATTALDLVDDPDRSGGLSNAATVVAEPAPYAASTTPKPGSRAHRHHSENGVPDGRTPIFPPPRRPGEAAKDPESKPGGSTRSAS